MGDTRAPLALFDLNEVCVTAYEFMYIFVCTEKQNIGKQVDFLSLSPLLL